MYGWFLGMHRVSIVVGVIGYALMLIEVRGGGGSVGRCGAEQGRRALGPPSLSPPLLQMLAPPPPAAGPPSFSPPPCSQLHGRHHVQYPKSSPLPLSLQTVGKGIVVRNAQPQLALALDLVWYGVYFGVLGRDAAEVSERREGMV